MANSRIKKTDAENAKKFLTDIVKSYYLTTEEEKAQHRNTGALKYLKDTMVSAVVLSPNPVKRMRKESFLKYFTQNVLPREYDTLIAYTDPEQNWKALLSCPYLWDKDAPSDSDPEDSGFTSNGILIPFFILQDLQRTVEQHLDEYLRQNILSPYDVRERTSKDDSNDEAKEKKYMHLVYTVQYYEIFMEEFRRRIMKEAGPTDNEDNDQTEEILAASSEYTLQIKKLQTALSECTEDTQKILLAKEILDVMQEDVSNLNKKTTALYYPILYVYHYINLMAMLRILFIAEYVNINQGYTSGSNDKDKERRRKNIELMVNQNLLGFSLYFFNYRNNPNLSTIFRELTIVAEKKNIIPDVGNPEEMNEFQRNLKMYIGQIQKKKAGAWDSAIEELLIKTRIALAEPFLSTLKALKQEPISLSSADS